MSRHHHALNAKRWSATRWVVLTRDSFRCQAILPDGSRCLRSSRLECHHRVAIEHGGDPYDLDNAVTYCRRCHLLHHQAEKRPEAVREWDRLMRETHGC